jgi:glycosyltransferase involved in cell wall biosynthesis
MNKLLMIVYHFHPDLEVGAVRSVKFAKYLPTFNWLPVVLTVKESYYQNLDQQSLGFDCAITRTSKWPTLNDFYLMLRRKTRQEARAANAQNTGGKTAYSTDAYVLKRPRLWKRVIDSLSCTPDDKIGWIFPGVAAAVKLVNLHKISAIYSSGPPHSCHLVALFTKLFTRKPWIADFRDPWTLGTKSNAVVTAASLRLEKFLERRVMKYADFIVTNTPEQQEALVRAYGDLVDKNSRCILNGFDDSDFPILVRREEEMADPTLTILYAGTLYMGRDPSPLFRALQNLISRDVVAKANLRLRFIGSVEIGNEYLDSQLDRQGLRSITSVEPPMSRAEYLEAIRRHQILLLMQSDLAPTQIPAKTFEYLATGNPVLALVSEGATARFVRRFENVRVADPDDSSSIQMALIDLFTMARSGSVQETKISDQLKSLSKRELTELLVSQLNELVRTVH